MRYLVDKVFVLLKKVTRHTLVRNQQSSQLVDCYQLNYQQLKLASGNYLRLRLKLS